MWTFSIKIKQPLASASVNPDLWLNAVENAPQKRRNIWLFLLFIPQGQRGIDF